MSSDQLPPTRSGLPPGLFRPVRVDRQGVVGPTPKSARGPRWRTSTRGYSVPVSVSLTPRQRVLEASMALPSSGGVTGWGGLAWLGASWFDGRGAGGLPRPVTLATAGADIRAQPGLRVSAERLDPRDVRVVNGVSITHAVRSVWFEMRYAESELDAVRACSMAAYDDLVSLDEMWEWSVEHPGWTGAPRCRAALALAHENCWAPTEVDLAYIWEVLADLPRPLCNRPIFDRRGNHIGTPDLLDLEAGVIGQYNGSHHLQLVQAARDIRGEERYRAHGLECFTAVATDLKDRDALATRMQSTRRRARFAAESTRSWTVVPPPWWIPTHAVSLRRALPVEERDRLLAYRRVA